VNTVPDDDPLAAVLIQAAEYAEKIGRLDTRESGHHRQTTTQLDALAADVAELARHADRANTALARHTTLLDSLEGLGGQVAALADQLAMMSAASADEVGSQYQPTPQPRWWKLTGADRDTALDRLAAWVEQIYQPSYGRLAATLPLCWREHPLCLYTLDWLSELWSVLYLGRTRDAAGLAAQAEWQTRLLPAAAEQMSFESRNCRHHARPGL